MNTVKKNYVHAKINLNAANERYIQYIQKFDYLLDEDRIEEWEEIADLAPSSLKEIQAMIAAEDELIAWAISTMKSNLMIGKSKLIDIAQDAIENRLVKNSVRKSLIRYALKVK